MRVRAVLIIPVAFLTSGQSTPGGSPAWEIVKGSSGGAAAKVAGPGQAKSIVVTCISGQPSIIVKFSPPLPAQEAELGISFITNRQQAVLKRYQSSDGWIATGVPATMLDLMSSPSSPVVSVNGKGIGRLSSINARSAISAAIRPCATAGPLTTSKSRIGFDIRGVKLGMTLAEAQAAVAAAGFPTALKTVPDTIWRASDSRLQRYKPYGRGDMEFDSIFAATKRAIPGNWAITDRIVVAFMPPPSARQAWAIAQYTRYARGSGPSARQTVAALVKKFGRPSAQYNADFSIQTGGATLKWYFDASGRQLGPDADASCKDAHHRAYMMQSDDVKLQGTNMAAIKPDWAAGAVRAGCATSLRAIIQFLPATGEMDRLDIDLIDLRNGYASGQRSMGMANQRANGALNAQQAETEKRKAAF